MRHIYYQLVATTFVFIFSLFAAANSTKDSVGVPIDLVGELEVLIEDSVDLKTHKMQYYFQEKGKKPKKLKFKNLKDDDHRHLKSGPYRIRGQQKGGELEVDTIEEIKSDANQSATQTDTKSDAQTNEDEESSGAQCQVLGAQRIVSVLVNLKDYKLAAGQTRDFMLGALLGNDFTTTPQTVNRSIDLYWRQASENRTWVDATDTKVIGPLEINENYNKNSSGASYCDYYALRDKVIEMIDPSVDFKKVDRLQIIMPANGACSWAGVANLGCRSGSTAEGTVTFSTSWNRADTMKTRDRVIQLSTHEIGHNLGLSHASTVSFAGEPLGPIGTAGSRSEYGDNFSTMGSWNYGFYAASQMANILKWFGPSDLVTVESSRLVTLRAFEVSTLLHPRAVKIRRGSATTNDWLWIEARKNTSTEFPNASAFANGAMIRNHNAFSGNKSDLLDFQKATTTFNDGFLAVGETWKDPYTNLEISVIGSTAQTLDLRITFEGSVPPTLAAPKNLKVK